MSHFRLYTRFYQKERKCPLLSILFWCYRNSYYYKHLHLSLTLNDEVNMTRFKWFKVFLKRKRYISKGGHSIKTVSLIKGGVLQNIFFPFSRPISRDLRFWRTNRKSCKLSKNGQNYQVYLVPLICSLDMNLCLRCHHRLDAENH